MRTTLLITCEHASATIPAELAATFATAGDVLRTHRAWDAGAWDMAQRLAQQWGNVPLFGGEVSRLVCDLNRSEHSSTLWSAWTRALPVAVKTAILNRWYHPYREAVVRAVATALHEGRAQTADGAGEGNRVLHLSLHSFTPVWAEEERNVDLGLLYDPARTGEKTVALALQRALQSSLPAARIRRNAPYRGTSDGLTTTLRTRYPTPPDSPNSPYIGLEVECNQGGRYPIARHAALLAKTLGCALAEMCRKK